MGISWHNDEYKIMVLEMEEYFSIVYGHVLDKKDVHEIIGRLVNIMIDNGAVDPT